MEAPPAFVARVALTRAELDAAEAEVGARLQDRDRTGLYWPASLLGLAAALAGAGVLVVAGVIQEGDGLTVAFVILASFGLGVAAATNEFWRSHRRARKLRWSSTPFLGEERVIEIREDGIHVRGPSADAWWRWTALTDVTVRGGSLFFWVGGGHAFSIPTRAFAGLQQAEAALAYARDRISRAAPAD